MGTAIPAGLQRSIAFFVAAALLVLGLPLLIGVVVVLRTTGSGQVLSLQPAQGSNGRQFTRIRFASRLSGDPQLEGPPISATINPCLVAVGGFFERTGINRLPQLLNVLKGDLRLFGPSG